MREREEGRGSSQKAKKNYEERKWSIEEIDIWERRICFTAEFQNSGNKLVWIDNQMILIDWSEFNANKAWEYSSDRKQRPE